MAESTNNNKKKSTKTSKYGVSKRENHDSSDFYNLNIYKNRTIYQENSKEENTIDKSILNKIFCSSSDNLKEINDNSIHLMVTSPPYNVGKEYDNDLTLQEYLTFLRNVMKEVHRVLVYGGRACINIANLGRKPYLPLHAYLINIMEEIGFLMRGEIIWDKSSSAGGSTAWGSWMSAKNPILRDTHEYILIFSKGNYSRNSKGESTITKEEFLEYTKSVWYFQTASAKKTQHPAPFPEELPRRLIQLYTYKNDIVLDPFMGSGQTALAALKNNRNYIGYDNNEEYCSIAEKRIKKELTQKTLTDPNFYS